MRRAAPLLLLGCFPRMAAALCTTPGDPDCLAQRESFTGTVDFFATGASFAVNDDADDRPDALAEEATVEVPEGRIPARATLVRALLYYGGSLFFDGDGNEAPDPSVELRVPGATGFSVVQAEATHSSGSIPGFPEVVLYAARADITPVLRAAGSRMSGRYTVRGFAADLFDGPSEHTAASASFSVVLVFEEPRRAPRTVVLFDGMQEVLGSTVTLDLSGFIVSPLPSGSLTIYALEGDCHPGPESCARGNNLAGAERVRVLGQDAGRALTLSDALNPANDIFNRTINTVVPPLSEVPGTDIDTFDISSVLRAGDQRVAVEITTPAPRGRAAGELVGLAYVVVGIDVFAPELRVDSRIEIRSLEAPGASTFFPGDPLLVTYAVSNTGNLRATEVELQADLPALVERFAVLRAPEGARVSVEERGGAFGRGRVRVEGLSVRHGEVDALVLGVETACPLDQDSVLAPSALVGGAREGGSPFTVSSSVTLTARDRCGPRFFLFGGGGCSSAGPGPLWPLLVLAGVALARRRSRAWLLAVLGLAGCGTTEEILPDRTAPAPPGVACSAPDDMVRVQAAGLSFCVDRYEASLASGALGNREQPEGGDGSTTARAQSVRFARPLAGVSWHQARAACRNAGKRLCTALEWSLACGGEELASYPYGERYEAETCNGFDAGRQGVVETGAMLRVEERDGVEVARGCVSAAGAFDLSGNVWEWNDSAFLDGARRGLAGGSFRSNRSGLRCTVEDSHAPAEELDAAYGFRCCGS